MRSLDRDAAQAVIRRWEGSDTIQTPALLDALEACVIKTDQPMPGNEQSALEEARTWAQHGYELGQRFSYWTDDGFRPAWLSETWERAERARRLKDAS